MSSFSAGVTAQRPKFTTTTVTIAAGASLSNAAQINGKLVGIIMPAAWTAATLSFQGSLDNVTFIDMKTVGSANWDAVATPTANAWHMMSNASTPFTPYSISAPYLKIRSGIVSAAVNQAAQRILTLLVESG